MTIWLAFGTASTTGARVINLAVCDPNNDDILFGNFPANAIIARDGITGTNNNSFHEKKRRAGMLLNIPARQFIERRI